MSTCIISPVIALDKSLKRNAVTSPTSFVWIKKSQRNDNRKRKELVLNPVYYGMLMVKDEKSKVDGLVSGAIHSTADTLRPALQI